MFGLFLVVIFALVVGYIMGVISCGIHIHHHKYEDDEETEVNKSIGIPEFMDYYEKTDGANKF